jgi:hypothetical protein
MSAGFWIMYGILTLYAAVRIFLGYAEYDTSHLKYRESVKRLADDAIREEENATERKEENKLETF